MQKIDIKINKSKIYFTPLFNEIVPVLYFKLLKNTYLWYDNFQEETFCMLYEFDGSVRGQFGSKEGFTIYEQNTLMPSPYYRGHRDFGRYVLYEFGLSDELLEFRNKLIEGKYSKFREEQKDIILKFNLRMYGPNERDHIQKVLYKDKSLIRELADKYGEHESAFPEALSRIIPEKEMFANALIQEERDEYNRLPEGSIEN